LAAEIIVSNSGDGSESDRFYFRQPADQFSDKASHMYSGIAGSNLKQGTDHPETVRGFPHTNPGDYRDDSLKQAMMAFSMLPVWSTARNYPLVITTGTLKKLLHSLWFQN
jgi:hypothetical protein